LKKKEQERKICFQRELDQKKLLLGNNGYIVKDGQPMPMTMPGEGQLSEEIKINVEFVK